MVFVTTDAANDVLASSKLAGAETHEPYVDPDEQYDPDAEDQEGALAAAAGAAESPVTGPGPGSGDGEGSEGGDGGDGGDGGEGGAGDAPKGSGRTPADYRHLGDFTRVIFPRFSAERTPQARVRSEACGRGTCV